MKSITAAALAACIPMVVAGCAKPPGAIAASYISDVPYRSYTCQQLGEEEARLHSALASASTQQERARTNDTVGVIFLGLPVSSLSGDNVAPEIARLKGEIEAVGRAQRLNACTPPAPIAAAPVIVAAPAPPPKPAPPSGYPIDR